MAAAAPTRVERCNKLLHELKIGGRVAIAVKSTVHQLMEKKQHMRWTKSGAQILLHARCALINGELGKYTGWSPSE